MFRAIEFVDQIKGFSIIGQGEKAVREPFGNIHHAAILGGELCTETLTESRRTRTQIEYGVIKGTADTANDFGFSLRVELIVHAAQCAALASSELLIWTKSVASPGSANSFSQKARAKKPRSSPRFSRSIKYAPASGRLGEDHDFPVSTEEVESILERAEADELVALEVRLAESVLQPSCDEAPPCPSISHTEV